ncbi:zinc metallochaperone AztD [Isoptericola sp. NPDC058082]|uniref:zinc metallochaperone AztD n=1 Tax=Isoptericola sp. NPDC058082 TaxID=3346331 RepID=UPI0036E756D4
MPALTRTTRAGRRRQSAAGLLALAVPLALASCASADPADGAASAEPAAEPSSAETAQATEAAAATARIALTYDGGVVVLDAQTLEQVADLPLEGFTRLNPVGDGRHLLASTTGGFRALDLGAWAEAHGDHHHYWTSEPRLTDVTYAAEEPGHVVVHGGRTVLFDDGTGQVRVLDSAHVAEGEAPARELTTPSAHHGVAVELGDDSLLVTEGTEESRSGVRVLDADDQEIAASDDCPGVHGEAVAADEAVVVGCEDGVLVYADGELTKVQAPDAYGRIGNQAGSEESPVVLGDYKTDPDAELERPTRVSLVDTRSGDLSLVDLPSSYTFRSLARGADGAALVLGTDGSLHVIDPGSGKLTTSIPVIDAWEEPAEWQEPRPAVLALDGSVYVTDPATKSVHAVDVESGEVWKSVRLDVAPNEISGVSGDVEASGTDEHDHEAHDGEAHDGEAHDHE